MGRYLNPGAEAFAHALNSEIYVDKTGMLEYTNRVINTEQRYICVSRPRRFGKSMAANMLAAYYGKDMDAKDLFSGYQIAKALSFEQHLNHYPVIFLNMQEFLSRSNSVRELKNLLEKRVIKDLIKAYPDVDYVDSGDLVDVLSDIYEASRIPFVFIVDEWDCIFRENKEDQSAQKVYLDFLRVLLKDKKYVALAYMTGILPIKKYGSHSALNMFDEFSMTNPKQLAEFVGFTESEVRNLCSRYNMDYEETKRWYDGYQFERTEHIYSPRSVISAMLSQCFDSYWNQTETFEALRDYIVMNYEGLKDAVIELMAGGRKIIDTGSFSNDMTTFSAADDILTLLIHLGYLGYDFRTKEVFIPNSEIAAEFLTAVKSAGWNEVVCAVKSSFDLLQNTWQLDEKAVAAGIDDAHFNTSILSYNDENSLACVISIAFYSAKEFYITIRELPTGRGFADIVFIPRKQYIDKPAMIVELKWDKSAEGAIRQIKDKRYLKALESYKGNLLLVGINYDKKTKRHECLIEKVLY